MLELSDADLAAIWNANATIKMRLVVMGRDGTLRMSWDEAANAVDRTDKLLAEVNRLRAELRMLSDTEQLRAERS